MKNLLKLEEAIQWLIAAYLATELPFAWWWYWVWFLAPDIGFIGYVVNARMGAFTYNLLHHKGVALIVLLVGTFIKNNELIFAGLVLYGHSSMDRVFGYGLKYNDSFQHTHLGMIGKMK